MADGSEQASVDGWIIKLVGWCALLTVLSIVMVSGGVVLTVGLPVDTFPKWLGPSILVVGLTLGLISCISLLVAAAHLRLLMQK